MRRHLFGKPQYRDFDVMPMVTAFNLILGAHGNRFNGGGIMVGRNRFFFPGSSEAFNLGGALEAYKGFYSSIRPAHRQLLVNVNGELICPLVADQTKVSQFVPRHSIKSKILPTPCWNLGTPALEHVLLHLLRAFVS